MINHRNQTPTAIMASVNRGGDAGTCETAEVAQKTVHS
jgi:hypothetical protein